MNYGAFEQFTQFNKNLSQPLAQLQTLASQTAEKLTQHQMNTAQDFLNLGVKHARNFSTVKKPEEAFDLQSTFLNEAMSKYMENMNSIFNTAMQASTEYNKVINESLKAFAEAVSAKVDKAA